MKIFELHDTEETLAAEFIKEHIHPEIPKGAIGGHISYIFTPTSIGTGVSIKCELCDTEKNITDYDCW